MMTKIISPYFKDFLYSAKLLNAAKMQQNPMSVISAVHSFSQKLDRVKTWYQAGHYPRLPRHQILSHGLQHILIHKQQFTQIS